MNNIAKVLKVIGVLKIIAEVIIGLVLGLNFNGLKFYGVKWGIVIQ